MELILWSLFGIPPLENIVMVYSPITVQTFSGQAIRSAGSLRAYNGLIVGDICCVGEVQIRDWSSAIQLLVPDYAEIFPARLILGSRLICL